MLAYLFVVIAVAVRFLPHPWAFTPVGAALLYFGARQPRNRIWIPLALLAVSDVLLTRYTYWYAFTLDTLVTWAWYVGILLLGGWLRDNARPLRLAGASLGASVSFFLLSNFAVWAAWSMYPKDFGGLIDCYAAAVPFFRQPIADLLFVAVFFSIGAFVEVRRRAAVRA